MTCILKKISMFSILLIILTVFPIIASAELSVTLVPDKTSVQTGETLNVSVVVSGNEGLVSLRLNVFYELGAVRLVGVFDSGILGGTMHESNYDLMPYTLWWNNPSSEVDFTANGTVAVLTFLVTGNAGGTEISTDPDTLDFDDYNASFAAIAVDGGSASVEIGTAICSEHSYGEWATVLEPTEASTGIKQRTCSLCGNVQTEIIPVVEPEGHIHTSSEPVTTVQPSCESVGRSTVYCSECGDELYSEELPALGHSFSEWTVATEATETETGVIIRTCDRCGTVQTEQTAKLSHEHIFNDDSKEELVLEPTCTESGMKRVYCASLSCDGYKLETVPATGHIPAEDWTVYVNATPERDGIKQLLCRYCGAVLYSETVVYIAESIDETPEETEKTTVPEMTVSDKTQEVLDAVIGDLTVAAVYDIPDGERSENGINIVKPDALYINGSELVTVGADGEKTAVDYTEEGDGTITVNAEPGTTVAVIIPDSTADIHDETAKESGFDSKAVIIIVIIAALAGILIPAVILIKKRK